MSDPFDLYMATRQHSPLIGPSSLHTCIRQLAYGYMGAAPTDEVDNSAADFGTLVHLGWSAMIRALYDPIEREPDVEVDWGGPRPGTCDDVDWVNRVVTDLKIPGGRSYQWQVDHGPKQDYVDQLQCYAHGLNGRDIFSDGNNWVCRLYLINRDNPQQRHTFEFPYDPLVADRLVEEANERHRALAQAQQDLDGDPYELAEMFPREGRGVGSFPCDWCRFESRCWPAPADPAMTPMSAEVAGDTDQIVDHARKYLEANAEASRWKREADAERGWLAGLDGTYTSDGVTVKVSTVGGNPRPDVPDVEAMTAMIGAMGLDVPMTTQNPSARYTKVGRVK